MAKHLITGAFGYTGKYICKKLLEKGEEVMTISNSLNRQNPFQGKVKAFPYHFDDEEQMVKAMTGASVLYNSYWVRFNHHDFQHNQAVKNTITLFKAAKKAGIQKIIHVSITNPSFDSDLEYFSGKAILEKNLLESGLDYVILRPAVIFGLEDILIQNIAWMIRKFPVFAVFGQGDYKLQPIFVEDLAQLAIDGGLYTKYRNCVINAIGPETYSYKELVLTIAKILKRQINLIHVSPKTGYILGKLFSMVKKDVTITREEIKGLMDNLLYVEAEPAGNTKLSVWLTENLNQIGSNYNSELARRRNRTMAYSEL